MARAAEWIRGAKEKPSYWKFTLAASNFAMPSLPSFCADSARPAKTFGSADKPVKVTALPSCVKFVPSADWKPAMASPARVIRSHCG